MTRSEIAVWSSSDGAPVRGVVLKRGGPRAAVLVRWDSGREERVLPGEPSVRYAFEGTQRLRWILDPTALKKQFSSEPKSVFVDVIRDEGRLTQTATIKRRLTELGLSTEEVTAAFESARPLLTGDPHVIVNRGFNWSEQPVDPWDATRKLDPHVALDQLLQTARFKPGQKAALGDAVRAGLSPRR